MKKKQASDHPDRRPQHPALILLLALSLYGVVISQEILTETNSNGTYTTGNRPKPTHRK